MSATADSKRKNGDAKDGEADNAPAGYDPAALLCEYHSADGL